jgi:hypothetical protein
MEINHQEDSDLESKTTHHGSWGKFPWGDGTFGLGPHSATSGCAACSHANFLPHRCRAGQKFRPSSELLSCWIHLLRAALLHFEQGDGERKAAGGGMAGEGREEEEREVIA